MNHIAVLLTVGLEVIVQSQSNRWCRRTAMPSKNVQAFAQPQTWRCLSSTRGMMPGMELQQGVSLLQKWVVGIWKVGLQVETPTFQ
jgi:hypothetical protein